MQITSNIRRMCVVAGLSVLGAVASAAYIPLDTQIFIDRAINSPTLTIRYDGANAALVELRINGESLGTRSVNAAKSAGETNFNIDLSQLKDGDNEVEVRLFDRAGKLVGSDKTNISTDQSDKGPVFLRTPKVGATVQGPVEINLGFGKELKNIYVSFFVDSDFKKMTNYPPYSFLWDTSVETNGWHEVEAWVIDDTSTTYKTRKTRIFVNNPGGRTDRPGTTTTLNPKSNPIRTGVTGTEVGTKSLDVKATGTAAGATSNGGAPSLTAKTTGNKLKADVAGSMSSIKPITETAVLATGAKSLMPTGKHTTNTLVATAKPVPTTGPGTVINSVATVTNMVKVTRGQRFPNLTTFAVVLNSQFVNFDVAPRVDDGVPMTPFRHLMEKAGGSVDWENLSKSVNAKADGKNIFLHIGDSTAKVNDLSVSLERAPYLDRGRTIVPLSFLHDALNVDIEFDKDTGHVLITSAKK